MYLVCLGEEFDITNTLQNRGYLPLYLVCLGEEFDIANTLQNRGYLPLYLVCLGEECDIANTRKKNFLPDILSSSKDKEKEDHRLTLLKEEPILYHELCQVC